MELYREYPAWLIFLRRTYAVAAGVLALPIVAAASVGALLMCQHIGGTVKEV